MNKYATGLFTKEEKRNPSFKFAAIVSIVLFGLGVVSAYILFDAANNQYTNRRTDSANQQLNALAAHISVKTAVYQQSLLAATGLITADGVENVDQTKWNLFIDSMQLLTYSPDVRGLGFARIVKGDEAIAFEQERRDAGFTDYTINPAGTRDEYVPVTYSRTFGAGTAPAYGYDMLAEPTRRGALERARDTGELAITAPILLREDDQHKTAQKRIGVVLYYPVYAQNASLSTVEERRENIVGYVYTAYRFSDMLQYADGLKASTSYKLWDISDTKPTLLNTAGSDATTLNMLHDKRITVGGRTWQAKLYMAGSTYERIVRPWLRFGAGVVVSIIISVIAFSLLLKRFKKVQSGHEAELQKTKNELLALASHQLRTPATSARQYIGILVEGHLGKLTKDQLSVAKKAYASNERQLEVIDQVLYVAKADSGQLMLSPEHLNLNELTKSIAEDFKDAAAEKKIKTTVSVPKFAVSCRADKRYVRMILENLLSNAIKYSYPKSTVHVDVSTAGTRARVAVRDYGVGIAGADTPKLFQKFTRIQNPLSQKEGGSGLGLFLAHKLAEAHDGKIMVASELGKGSTFTLSLPRKASAAKNVVQLTE